MTTYADTADVNVLMGPHRITETTKLTLSDLEKLLLNVDSDLNARLNDAGVGVIPVLDPAFTGYLKTLASWSAAAQAFKIQFPEAMGPGEQPAYAYWEKRYQAALLLLSGAIPGDLISGFANAAVSSYFTKHPEEEAEMGNLAGASLFTVDNLQEKGW